MKKFLISFFFIVGMENIHAQQVYADSLLQAFRLAKEDNVKVATLNKLSYYYSFLYPDSAIYYADSIINFSQRQKYKQGEAIGWICKAEGLDRFASYPEALEAAYKSLEISKTLSAHRLFMMGWSYEIIGHLNGITGKNKDAINFFHTAIDLLTRSGEDMVEIYFSNFSIAYCMWQSGQIDSAVFYITKLDEHPEVVFEKRNPTPWLIRGNIYNAKGDASRAESYFKYGLAISEQLNTLFLSTILYNSMAYIFLQKGKRDSSIYYAKRSLSLAQKYNYKLFEIGASGFLSYNVYDGVNADSALKYMRIMFMANNDAFNADRGRQFQKVSYDAEKKEKELADAKKQFKNKIRVYLFIIALIFLLIVAFIFWRNNRHKKKANLLLVQQKEKLETTLEELKTTQKQLIQSEKMASLGELTAGIAHEIQNPLNFVNNFSEVNSELIDELEQEADKGNLDEVRSIVKSIKENEGKINHHGKRAETIVKSMLQHSRSSSGKKEPVDINKLCDEYLRLSYHGLRAKDKSFNATMKTDFDDNIGKINIIPQDIGRVVLNLINNAFYAVDEKKKSGYVNYEPTVSISTQKNNGKVKIKVRDNGNGIPQKVLDKIFQPFFTTKPTGQGTGLGLSLSYDIVKAHGGELKVETKEGEGSIFMIDLPV